MLIGKVDIEVYNHTSKERKYFNLSELQNGIIPRLIRGSRKKVPLS
jgi:hypothetical protein